MKIKTRVKRLALAAIFTLPLIGIPAELTKQSTNQIHKVAFEIAIDGAEKWNAALRNVENVQKSFGAATTQIEVVTHGKGVGMLLATTASGNPEIKARVEKMHTSGVVFAACENTMKKMQIAKDQLVPLATTVDSGVSEIIRKQESGLAPSSPSENDGQWLALFEKRKPGLQWTARRVSHSSFRKAQRVQWARNQQGSLLLRPFVVSISI